MAETSAPTAPPKGAPSGGAWLHGPIADMLLGAGVLYFALFAVLSLFPAQVAAWQPAYLLPGLVILVSMPHYGGTLVRVYESRDERRAYALFTVWATLAILALFVWGVYAPFVARCC